MFGVNASSTIFSNQVAVFTTTLLVNVCQFFSTNFDCQKHSTGFLVAAVI